MAIKTNLLQINKLQVNLTFVLQQAFHVLQLPITELASWVQLQIEENPLLQFQDARGSDEATELDFDRQGFEVLDELDETFIHAVFPEYPQSPPSPENLIPASTSLYHHLMQQAKIAFNSPSALHLAEQIIGNLDHQGFLGDFKADPDILAKIQTFDPPGIAARSLQESLLIQLKGKEGSLAYQLIAHHFDDLLRSRWSYLTKTLGYSLETIQAVLRKEISPLDFHPASKFQTTHFIPLIPDIIVDPTSPIKINEDLLPAYTLNPSPCSEMNRYHTAGKWMEKILARRRHILTQIMEALLKKHPEFFHEGKKTLHTLSLEQLAEELGLHCSTVARAVKDKYVACPRGVFPLKYFFPHTSTVNEEGTTISHLDAKKLLQELIRTEDKKKPFSDSALTRLMIEAGIPCARRTITKYRRLLHIPSAAQRKK